MNKIGDHYEILFFITLYIFSLVVDAQDYRVVSRGNLHVRSGAGTEFDVIEKLVF